MVVSYFQGSFLILWGTWKKNHENSGHFWHHTPRCAGEEKIRYFYLKFHFFSNFKLNFHLQLQLQSLRWYDMFLLHFLSSTKVSLAYFAQFRMVHCKNAFQFFFFFIYWNSKKKKSLDQKFKNFYLQADVEFGSHTLQPLKTI